MTYLTSNMTPKERALQLALGWEDNSSAQKLAQDFMEFAREMVERIIAKADWENDEFPGDSAQTYDLMKEILKQLS